MVKKKDIKTDKIKETFAQRICKIQFVNNEFTKAINLRCDKCSLPFHFRKTDHELKKHPKFKIINASLNYLQVFNMRKVYLPCFS